MSADAGITRADYADAALTQPVPGWPAGRWRDVPLQRGGASRRRNRSGLASTYKDEVVAAFETEVLPAVSLGVRYVYRDMPRVLEDIGQASMVEYFNDEADFGSVE